ncbi:unnamed protein product [Haemonchus placei]|uniref:Uncharacterized protein n=1 Tax=Haemonchus placei TaxID=6290 RepID=A0A0N4WEJ5_HAEPC|nr:unnamed protein product [Haemonchus placei]
MTEMEVVAVDSAEKEKSGEVSFPHSSLVGELEEIRISIEEIPSGKRWMSIKFRSGIRANMKRL